MNRGGAFVKYLFYILNMILVICGIFIIVSTSIIISHIRDSADSADIADSEPSAGAVITFLVLGCIIFILAFFGCYGAIRENAFWMFIYSACMLILFVAHVALVLCHWKKGVTLMERELGTIWQQHNTNQSAMDDFQLRFNCCGKNGYTDYAKALALPNSCCGADATSCGPNDAMKRPGCKNAIRAFWISKSYVPFGVTVVELFAFIFGCSLAY